ncbi:MULTISPECIES: DUF1269 domain-containing protein [unclassified Streptomyces]|uniref:DUF1269 domain-containing protein n=1 Tax=unclassified Streptomyces TaxID=2593676 RepID=UPI0008DE7A28|nr:MULTISPECIES: DUF1269 domain-containing protein [unclassified Streptomyces]OII68904.1 hypothetical protein BJP39_04630 [Streptomyces sp. CC77]
MATLTVWKFDTPEGAETAERVLLDLQKQELIRVLDAAVATWPQDAKKPKTKQLHDLVGAGALSGMFWGMLFGLIFLMPLFGAAIGAAAGALGGKMADVGIDDDFIESVKSQVTPGTSALFLLSQDAVVDRVKEAFPGGHAQLIQSNLDSEQEAKLREVFTE